MLYETCFKVIFQIKMPSQKTPLKLKHFNGQIFFPSFSGNQKFKLKTKILQNDEPSLEHNAGAFHNGLIQTQDRANTTGFTEQRE